MVAKSAVSIPRAALAADHKVPKNGKAYISTETLQAVLLILNTLAAAIACWYNPQAALAGGIFGALIRMGVGDNPRSVDMPVYELRANRVAVLNFTAMASAYTSATYLPASPGIPARCSFTAPFFIGYQGMANGFYPLARKLAG